MNELRPLLFSIAYRMLGSVSDAEDVVQEAFVRYERATDVESPKAWLTSVVTRLAIDQLRSAQARRETYVGEWLPEPIVDGDEDPAALAERADTLSMAFLLLLERLTPLERAVFLLHDVFGYRYDEIAELLGRNAAACRQLGTRARQHVEAEKPRFAASDRERDELAARFFAAVQDGSVDELVGMLAADAVVVGDGGGKAPQWKTPIVGAERVAKLLAGTGAQIRTFGLQLEPRRVNGQPGAILRTQEGEIAVVWTVEIVDGVVQTLRSVINPDKLRHLGPVADARALLRAHRTDR
jgi:RNA polymerase sigma-70 factor, ECF subfamily